MGLAPRAIAIRAVDAASPHAFAVYRTRANGRHVGGGTISALAVLYVFTERDWSTRQPIPARWDPESRMLVAVLPREA